MFARKVTMQLKPNVGPELGKTMELEVIPTLRKQKGFKDELTFLAPSGKEAFAISLWDAKENAELYGQKVFPELVKTLSKVLEGTPQVQTYEVAHTTLHTGAIPAVGSR